MANKQDTMIEAMYGMLVKVCGELGIAVDDPLSERAKNRQEAKALWSPGGALYEQSYGTKAGNAGAAPKAEQPADLTPDDAESADFAAGVTAGVENAQTDNLQMVGPDVIGDLPDAEDEADADEEAADDGKNKRARRGR